MLHVSDPLKRLDEVVPEWRQELDSAAMFDRLFQGADSLVDAFRQQFEAQFMDRMRTADAWELDEFWAYGPEFKGSSSGVLESLFPYTSEFLSIRNGLNARVPFRQSWGVVSDFSFARGAIYYLADPELERIVGRNHSSGRTSTFQGWALPRAPYEIISRWFAPTTLEDAVRSCFASVARTTLEHPEWGDRVVFHSTQDLLPVLDEIIGEGAEDWAVAFSALATFREWFTMSHIAEGMAGPVEETAEFLQRIANGQAMPATDSELQQVKTAYCLLLEAAFLSGPIADY